MTRLIRRALLATTAALAGLVLHGQSTTAGLLDLDELDGLTAAVVDGSQPSPDQTPIATLLDRTSSIVGHALDDLDAAVPVLDLPAVAPPAIPAIPPPAAPEAPVLDPDVGGPLPPIADPALPNPEAGVPPQTGDGGGPPGGDTGGPADPAPAPNTGPAVLTPPGPVISGPADAGVVATGDLARRPPTGGAARTPAIGSRPAAGSVFDTTTAVDPVSPTADSTSSNLGRTAAASPGSPSLAAGAGLVPVETTEGWGPTSRTGGGGLPGVALGIALAAIAASSIVIAVVRRAISRRGRRAEAAVDREREPTGRASADARPPRRVPPVRADDRTSRRVPPGRASADARPVRREPRSGVGGHPIDRVGRDRRAPRTPSARSARGDAQRASGSRRQSRAFEQPTRRPPVGGRASVTRPPARRTMTA